MARTPVTDDEIEEAVEKVKEASKRIEEGFGGEEVSDEVKKIYTGEVPGPDRLEKILNEIQSTIEREQDKYRKMMKSEDHYPEKLFENREIIVMRYTDYEIDNFTDYDELPEDDKFSMRRALYRAYRTAALRYDEVSDDEFYFAIVFRKPNQVE